jgi:hypothetical protein
VARSAPGRARDTSTASNGCSGRASIKWRRGHANTPTLMSAARRAVARASL